MVDDTLALEILATMTTINAVMKGFDSIVGEEDNGEANLTRPLPGN
jgi:hypothetical protein